MVVLCDLQILAVYLIYALDYVPSHLQLEVRSFPHFFFCFNGGGLNGIFDV